MSIRLPDDPATNDANPRYQLITKLGQGGMARVLLMLSRGRSGANKLLVVKELLPSLADDPDLRAMFLDEGRLAVRLNHPNVVQTYEVTDDAERPLIIMEYLEGQSVAALLERVGRKEMQVDLHLFILTQALIGLHHAHELCDFDGTPLGVVHRDVSPQNVFVTYDGQVKLLDFGIAKTADAENRTATGVFKGKMSYASPEQIEILEIDRRSDVFAMGVMLWEALARARISSNDDAGAMMRRLNGLDPKLGVAAPETPEELVRICEKAMAVDPAARFSTAEEFRAALSAYLDTSKRVGTHELGALVRHAFAPERTKIRELIDARMKDLGKAGMALSDLSSIDGQVDSPSVKTPSRLALAREGGDTTVLGRLQAMGTGGRIFLGGAVLSLATLGLVSLSRRSSGGAGPVVDAGAMVTIAAAPPEAGAMSEVTISADPPEARVWLDGVETSTNPFRGALPQSAAPHHVRVSAPGFLTEERLVVFDRNLQVQMQLRPAPPDRAAAARPAPPPPRAAHTRPAPEIKAPPATAAAPAVAAPPNPGEPPPAPKRTRSIDDSL